MIERKTDRRSWQEIRIVFQIYAQHTSNSSSDVSCKNEKTNQIISVENKDQYPNLSSAMQLS